MNAFPNSRPRVPSLTTDDLAADAEKSSPRVLRPGTAQGRPVSGTDSHGKMPGQSPSLRPSSDKAKVRHTQNAYSCTYCAPKLVAPNGSK